jgi:uncharacterized protein YbjT (DUF2867 family)
MKAIIIGASGLTGSALVEELIHSPMFEKIVIFGRRSVRIVHNKIEEHIIDFEQTEQWKHLVQGDVLFSCLGTTLKKAKTKTNQFTIDYTYQFQFATIAAENGVSTYVLVSSVGANSKSRFFYLRIKGKLEDDVKKIPFQNIHVLKPNILDGAREDKRRNEAFGLKIIKAFNRIGLLKKMKPTHVKDLAKMMIQKATGS